jgi:uncharacterized damage-inducible protein DinB
MRHYLNPFVASKTPWEVSSRRFKKTTDRIENMIEDLSPEDLERRVLIAPMTGLEDSSRYWSIKMVLEHLVIVGRKTAFVLKELDAGRYPEGSADTAKVKPTGDSSLEETLARFRKFTRVEYPALLDSLRNRDRSHLKYRHPWFGSMNMRGWYWLLSTHQRIHMKQIEAIQREMNYF